MQTQSRLVYETGGWEIDVGRHELRLRGAPVPIGVRALEVLEALVKSAGKLVTKNDLMGQVWPGAVVEENTLQVHIYALRKALGADRDLLRTHARRGYRLLGDWMPRERSPDSRGYDRVVAQPAAHPVESNLPVPISELIGRAAAVQQLRNLLSAYRVVTLTGTGGIGKTRLALEVARLLLPGYAGNVFWVELASLADGELLPGAIAGALGLGMRDNVLSIELVAQAIGNRKLLFVIDNCEHLIDQTAKAVEGIVRSCPAVSILATSRELLRIAGECTYRVPPLDVPAPGEEILPESSAIQLFIARMTDGRAGTQKNMLEAVAALCRRLDGIPLAIEFAAARAAVIGVEEVLSRLDDRFALLTIGRRTALSRQRTLRATLDWSYQLLADHERLLLARLAVFAGSFSLDAGYRVAAVADATLPETLEGLVDLAAKSLITPDLAGPQARFRLLETTRVYASEKLSASGERERIARRHAAYYRDLFARAEAEVLARPRREWLADYAWQIDNLRAALDWAFSPGGDVLAGIVLTAEAVPLWLYLSLIEECRHRVERALADRAAATAGARVEMKLRAALAVWLGQAVGAGTKAEEAWTRTLRLAESLGDVDYQLRALFGLWQVCDREALALAERFAGLASTPSDRVIGDQMMGHSCHIQGDQARARRHLERVAANHVAAVDSEWRIIRFDVDEQPTIFLSRVLWLQGFPGQAMAMAEQSVEHAKADDHAKSLCFVLAFAACPIALWAGNLDLADQYIGLLDDISSRHELTLWHALGRAHRGVLVVKRGDLEGGLSHLRAAFAECRVAPTGYRVLFFVGELIEALGRAGQTPEGQAVAKDALDRAERTAEGWIIAELLRVRGELLRLEGAPEAVGSAEACFRDALQMARMQGALSWEFRAATSLARLLRDQRRYADGVAILRPVYERFTEGFATTDLRAARALLDEFSGAACRPAFPMG